MFHIAATHARHVTKGRWHPSGFMVVTNTWPGYGTSDDGAGCGVCGEGPDIDQKVLVSPPTSMANLTINMLLACPFVQPLLVDLWMYLGPHLI